MIIKKIEIKNFRIFYGLNSFELSDGLNLIIGSNGDGKSTLYDALEWLFRTDDTNKMDTKFISKKRYEELSSEDSDVVRVSMSYEHKGKMKTLEKMFHFTKSFDGEVNTSNYVFSLIEGNGIERTLLDGKHIDKDLPPEIRKFIMFGDEAYLDVLQSSIAMKLLIDNFSEVRDFDAYFAFMEYATKNANRARDYYQKLDKKNQYRIKELNSFIEKETELLSDIEREIGIKENEAENYDKLLKNIEQSQESSKLLVSVNSRIENLKNKRSETVARIKDSYSRDLLENMWVLMGFDDIADEYSYKMYSLEKKFRGIERPQLEHNYFQELKEYETKLDVQLDEITKLRGKIHEKIVLNNRLQDDVKKIDANLENEFEQKKRILVQTDGLTEEQLMTNYESIFTWMDKKYRADNTVDILKRQREQHRELLEKAQLDLSRISEGTAAAMYAKTALILQQISDSFKNAKESNTKRLLQDIEDWSNILLSRLCPDTYTGIIRVVEKANGQGEIFLMDNNSCKVFNPGHSLMKSYLLSVMLVIAKLCEDKFNTCFPLIVEGSFVQYEEQNGNRFIDARNGQMIIITNDYLEITGDGERVLNSKKIKTMGATAYRIEKKRPFDAKKLGTLQTVVTRI